MSGIAEEIRMALDAATPGPWVKVEFLNGTMEIWQNLAYSDDGQQQHIARIIGNNETASANARLIANAPTWLRWQQGEIERLEKRVDALTDKLAESGELLVEALTVLDWYAGEQYGDVQFFPPIPDIPILHDCGEKARSILSRFKEEETK